MAKKPKHHHEERPERRDLNPLAGPERKPGFSKGAKLSDADHPAMSEPAQLKAEDRKDRGVMVPDAEG